MHWRGRNSRRPSPELERALSRARLLAKLGKNADAAVAFERLLADPSSTN